MNDWQSNIANASFYLPGCLSSSVWRHRRFGLWTLLITFHRLHPRQTFWCHKFSKLFGWSCRRHVQVFLKVKKTNIESQCKYIIWTKLKPKHLYSRIYQQPHVVLNIFCNFNDSVMGRNTRYRRNWISSNQQCKSQSYSCTTLRPTRRRVLSRSWRYHDAVR